MSDTPPVPPQPPVTPPPTPEQSTSAQPAYAQPAYAQPVYAQPAYGQPVYGQPGYPQPYAAAPPTNSLAIVALVLSLAGLLVGVTAIGGIVCGHIALAQIKRTGEGGRGFAIAGLVLGYVGIGFFVLFFAIWLVMFIAVVTNGYATGSLSS